MFSRRSGNLPRTCGIYVLRGRVAGPGPHSTISERAEMPKSAEVGP
jgi:hypothetical protein